MLEEISKKNKEKIREIVSGMTLKEKVAQVLCYHINSDTVEDVKELLKEIPLGAVYFQYNSARWYKEMAEIVQNASQIPVLISSDINFGAGARIEGCLKFPWQMAMGAADSEELVYQAARATAIEGRAHGVNWVFSPVVDLNKNFNNPITNVRAFGENPDHVIRLSKAFIRGLQENGMMAAGCKHFPGDGMDDRDQHMCTTINSLSRDEWNNTYGKVWKEVINEGTMSIMPGHIALPCVDPGNGDYLGPTPATLSKKLQIDLLKKELGFEGVLVSDAIPMVGLCSHLPADIRVAVNIKAGSDMAIFVEPKKDFQRCLKAVREGYLEEERLDDAVKRVLELKARVRLFDDDVKFEMLDEDRRKKFYQVGEEIGKRSISIIRNEDKVIPLSLKKGAKVLTITIMYYNEKSFKNWELKIVDEELKKRGFVVDHLLNPKHQEILDLMNKYDAIFVNFNIIPHDTTNTNRLIGMLPWAFWRAFWMDCNNVVFTAFGDPYKIYEMPSVPNMINTYSPMEASQRAVVKVWLGEEKALGKNPVQLKGFFDIEVKLKS